MKITIRPHLIAAGTSNKLVKHNDDHEELDYGKSLFQVDFLLNLRHYLARLSA